jgi:hypothetical protein
VLTKVTPDDVLEHERQVDKETPPRQDGDEPRELTPTERHARTNFLASDAWRR